MLSPPAWVPQQAVPPALLLALLMAVPLAALTLKAEQEAQPLPAPVRSLARKHLQVVLVVLFQRYGCYYFQVPLVDLRVCV